MYPPEYQHLLDFLDSNPEYLQDMRTRGYRWSALRRDKFLLP